MLLIYAVAADGYTATSRAACHAADVDMPYASLRFCVSLLALTLDAIADTPSRLHTPMPARCRHAAMLSALMIFAFLSAAADCRRRQTDVAGALRFLLSFRLLFCHFSPVPRLSLMLAYLRLLFRHAAMRPLIRFRC